MKGLPEAEYRRWREFAVRAIADEKEAMESAKRGAPTPPPPSRAARSRSGRPGPGDIVMGDKQSTREYDGF
jgi:hypothetical protein